MIITIYADSVLAYDSRLPVEANYSILSARISENVSKGGTATIVLPPGHPLYNGFPAFRTPVEIYRDGLLRWRGRPLPESDDFYGRRTITCEGERCFLQDAIHRPYLYQSDPATIFTRVIAVYNAAVEPWKQFSVGVVTVKDPNDYIRFESENPEKVSDTINKLVERCGGYILFSTAEDGTRCINWYADLPYRCNQKIQFGYNLTDFSSQSDTSGFATRIIPYGARGEDGQRITIDVDGCDYVENAEAIALRGVIEKSVIYDDITEPENLRVRAQADVDAAAKLPSIIQLSAVDMSRMDLEMEAFRIGQYIEGVSTPHGLSGYYDLTQLEEDLVDPNVGSITLCRETASIKGGDGRTLSGAVAAGDRSNNIALEKAEQEIRADYTANIAVMEQRLTSVINQTADSITAEVAQQTHALDQVKTDISVIHQTSENVSIQVQSIIENGVGKVKTSMGYTLDDEGMRIQKEGQEIENLLDHTGMYVTRSGETMLQANANGVEATDVQVNNYLIIGKHARFEDYNDGTDGKRTACFWLSGEG